MKVLTERTARQDFGEKWDLQAHQELGESQDSKGKPVMSASLDRRVNLVRPVQLGRPVDRDMMVTPVPLELWDDLDLQDTWALQVQLDHQDLSVLRDWASRVRRDPLAREVSTA